MLVRAIPGGEKSKSGPDTRIPLLRVLTTQCLQNSSYVFGLILPIQLVLPDADYFPTLRF